MTRGSLGKPRVLALALGLVAAAALFLWQVHGHYPIQKWLFWRYALSWSGALAFALACVSSGFRLLGWLAPPGTLRPAERLLLSFSSGVVVFSTLTFVAGVAGLLGGVFFVALPLALVATGARPLLRWARRLVRHLYRARRSARPPPPLVWLAFALGLLGVFLVYLPILNPENASFDSRWQHLGMAEHYSIARRIERFPEGWFVGTSPQLAAILYTWAFTAPGSMLFDRVELAAHLEFVCFLSTLPGIVVLTRRLVPGVRARGVWALRFAFPGVFMYDSGLVLGADHVAALFAVPAFLSLLVAWRAVAARPAILFGLTLAGVLLTKHTATFLLVTGPALALALRALWLLFRQRRLEVLKALALFGLTVLAVTSSYWLKNWLWYGDPVYPVAHRLFGAEPWAADASVRFELGFVQAEHWAPPRTLAGVGQALKALVTFSFLPNDWPQFHGKVPVFGSLFTLSLVLLPFVRPTRRLLGLFALAHVGIFAWYWTHHQDRYLQAALPWLAAATAAVLVLVWRAHLVTRVGASVLVALQVIWGGDVPSFAGHVFADQPLKATLTLLETGYDREWQKRLRPFGSFYLAGSELERNDKVLVHDSRPRVGLRARAVSDAPGNQGALSYGELGSPRATYEALRGLGVTHLFWESASSKGADSVAGELVFWSFAARFTKDRKVFGGHTLATMPSEPPPAEWNAHALFFGCKTGGLFRVADLKDFGYDGTPDYPAPLEPLPPKPEPLGALLGKAGSAAVEAGCGDPAQLLSLGTAFEKVASSRRHEFWVKKP